MPQRTLVLLAGHTSSIYGIAFSPDGSLLATAGQDGKVILWETETAAVRFVWEEVYSEGFLGFTPDGETLVTGGGAASFWSARTGRWEGRLPWLMPLALPPGGRIVGTDGTDFLIVERSSGVILQRVPTGDALEGYPLVAAVSADGTIAAAKLSSDRRRIHTWDLQTGAHTLNRRAPTTLWSKTRDPKTGQLRPRYGASSCVWQLALSPDGRTLGVVDTGGFWLCRTRTGRRTHLLLCGVSAVSAAFSADGAGVAVGTQEGGVHVWTVSSGTPLLWGQGHTGNILAIAFSPDGCRVASGCDHNGLRLWDVASGERVRRFPTMDFHATAVAYSPDSARLAVSSTDGWVRVWSARAGVLERTLPAGIHRLARLVWSPDGAHLSTGAGEEDRVWDTATGTVLHAGDLDNAESPRPQWPPPYARSPDGRWEAVRSGRPTADGLWEGLVELRSREPGGPVHVLFDPDDRYGPSSLAFSPDSRLLAVGGPPQRVSLWDVITRTLRTALPIRLDSADVMAFSPDGQWLAVACSLRARIEVYDLPTRTQRVCLEGHASLPSALAFSPDGRTLASVGMDGTLKHWDPDTGALRATSTPLPEPDDAPAEEWITSTPTGYYVGSPGARRFLRWRVGEELVPGECFAEEYNSPARVAASLCCE